MELMERVGARACACAWMCAVVRARVKCAVGGVRRRRVVTVAVTVGWRVRDEGVAVRAGRATTGDGRWEMGDGRWEKRAETGDAAAEWSTSEPRLRSSKKVRATLALLWPSGSAAEAAAAAAAAVRTVDHSSCRPQRLPPSAALNRDTGEWPLHSSGGRDTRHTASTARRLTQLSSTSPPLSLCASTAYSLTPPPSTVHCVVLSASLTTAAVSFAPRLSTASIASHPSQRWSIQPSTSSAHCCPPHLTHPRAYAVLVLRCCCCCVLAPGCCSAVLHFVSLLVNV